MRQRRHGIWCALWLAGTALPTQSALTFDEALLRARDRQWQAAIDGFAEIRRSDHGRRSRTAAFNEARCWYQWARELRQGGDPQAAAHAFEQSHVRLIELLRERPTPMIRQSLEALSLERPPRSPEDPAAGGSPGDDQGNGANGNAQSSSNTGVSAGDPTDGDAQSAVDPSFVGLKFDASDEQRIREILQQIDREREQREAARTFPPAKPGHKGW